MIDEKDIRKAATLTYNPALDAYLNEGYEKAAAEIGRSLTMLLVLQSSYLHNYLDVLEALLLTTKKE